MVVIKGNVAIQVTNDFVWELSDSFIAEVASLDFGCKAPVSPLRHLDHFHPGMLRKIAAYDSGRPVRRSIVHDYPSRW